MELSILIVNWNTRDFLRQCLAAVQRAAAGLEAETIVVDNGSRDSSAEMIRRDWPMVHLIANDRNRGFAAANNQAFARSRGTFVLLLNTDALIDQASLTALLKTLRAEPKLGATTPVLRNTDGSIQYGYHRRRMTGWRLLATLLHNGRLWPGNPWARHYLMLDERFDRDQVLEQPAASCWLIRRLAIHQSGGLFDERFPIHFNDADLSERLWRQGWRTQLVTSAQVVHRHGVSVGQLDPYLRKELYLVSQLLFVRRFRPLTEYLILKATLVVVSLILLTLTSLGLTLTSFNQPVANRQTSLAAQRRILRSLWTERLPALP